jgi:PAS domain S-box-containing protein
MYVNPSDRESFVGILEATGELNNFEVQYRNKDGSVRDVLLYARPLVYAGESCIVTASLPITERKRAEQRLAEYRDHLEELVRERTSALDAEIRERKQAEEALRSSQQHLFQIIDFLPDATFVIDNEGKVVVWNHAIEAMTGIKAVDMVGKGDYEYAIPFYGERRPVLINLVSRLSQDIEDKYQYVEKEGHALVSETYDSLVRPGGYLRNKASLLYDSHGDVIGAIESIRDISDRKAAEEALSENEALLRATLESTADGILVVDEKGKVTYANNRFFEMWHVPGEMREVADDQILLDHVSDQLIDPEAFVSKVKELYRTAKDVYDTLLFKDGRVFERFSSPLLRGGNIEGRVWSFRDVTETKRLEKELTNSKNFLENIFNSSIDGITTTDPHGNITYSSPWLQRLTGFDPEEIIGKKVYLFYGNGKEDAKKIMRELTEKGELASYEIKLRKKDGEFLDIITSVSYVRDENGAIIGTLGIFKDITARRKLEAKLQNAQKMDAIAVLAGGIAHKFNNALSAIIGYTDLLRMEFSGDEKIGDYVAPMRESAHHMAHLTSQLLAYARGGKYEPRRISVTDFIRDSLLLIEHTLNPDVKVETDLPIDIGKVEADHTQMQMVLTAVVSNSNEAIEGSGRIWISARNLELDQAVVQDHPGLKPGPYVCVTIEDDGKGMDEEARERIFEPFFTTHFFGRGLGMAAVYGIVTNHGGTVTVDSELGRGTVVRIYLPALPGTGV